MMACFFFEEKKTGAVDQVFLYAAFTKYISMTALLNINSVFTERVIMKAFRLKRDGVIAS
jgi:hypothetical protein